MVPDKLSRPVQALNMLPVCQLSSKHDDNSIGLYYLHPEIRIAVPQQTPRCVAEASHTAPWQSAGQMNRISIEAFQKVMQVKNSNNK
jgi:hypothetical protein